MTTPANNQLAINGGAPIRSAQRPWPAWPVFGDAERRGLNDVLESGKWWYGERLRAFETDYAAYQGAAHCVACNSGTAAAEIFFQAIGIGPGDEVIVPPYTFFATASSVARIGAAPVFADVDDSWCLDPKAVEAAITPRTKAIVPVHFGGRIADMDRLGAIAEEYGLVILEDACHAWGARWRDRGAGVIGHAGVFSFQQSKNITAAEGGAITTNDEEIADKCRALINCGRRKGAEWYCHAYIGTNARMNEFAAAILSAQLTRLEEQNETRRANAALIDAGIAGIEGLIPQPGDERITRRGYHLYCLRIDPELFGCTRAQFIKAAEAEGLPISAGYAMPLYKQEVWEGRYDDCVCPVSEDLCTRSAMWLLHPMLLASPDDARDIAAICHKLKDNVDALKQL